LMSRRGSIIGMIREAANANGETFMEGIRDEEVQQRSVSPSFRRYK